MRSLSKLAVALLLASTASATDYYLDASTGSNANPGTAAQPWRTITFALAQPLASGDVLRLRGTFAAPAETFPLSLLPGVSLTNWDSSSTARIDAGAAPCIRIIRPGDHTEEIVGTAGSLVIVGAPAVRIEAPNAAMRCTSRIAGCRIEGRLEVLVATSAPAYGGYDVHVTVEDCEISGETYLFSNSLGDWSTSEMMSAWFTRCTLHGTLIAENPETRTRESLRVADCTIYGDLRCIETYLGDADICHILRNRIVGGSIICDSTPAAVSLLYPIVVGNTVERGDIRITLNGDDDAASAHGNTVRNGNLQIDAYAIQGVLDNFVAGDILVNANYLRGGGVLRNTCRSITASAGPDVTIEDNVVGAGGIVIPNTPHLVGVSRNTVTGCLGDGIRIGSPSSLSFLMGVWVQSNDVNAGVGATGSGVRIEGEYSRVWLLDNSVTSFSTGFALTSGSSPYALGILRNSTADCGTGIDLALSGAPTSCTVHGNTASRGQTGLNISHPTFVGSIDAWGNIFAGNSTADVAPGSLLPTDDVRGNLAEDGSLLDFHPSNISGDPHFVDAANGDFRLRPTSPCIAPGNNPAGGDIGRYQSGLQPTLEVVELGANLASFRTRGENGDHVILFIAAYPARPAALTFCDGLLGLDAPTILAVLPGIITFGRWDLIVDVPQNLPFTAVLQSLRVDLNAPNECSMTNTRFFRR